MTDRAQTIAEVKRFAHQLRNLTAFAESLEGAAELERLEAELSARVDALRTEERTVTERIAKLEIDGQSRHDAAVHHAELIIADAEKIRLDAVEAVNALKQEVAREIAAEREIAQAELAAVTAEIAAKRSDLQALNDSIVSQHGTLAAINAQLADVSRRLEGLGG
jgi:Skp family chaperone for outer membrane proteins